MPKLTIGARGSKLSVAQSKATIEHLVRCFPELDLHLQTFDTAGDIDKSTSLTVAGIADNFFSDILDQAVLEGKVDAAIHSAKDLPDYHGTDIDWFHLPWVEDRRDAVLYPRDRVLPQQPVVGISSPSREDYAKRRWPNCQIKSIRGNIEARIEQMDRGDFDVILLAVAGLKRLGVDHRIDEILELSELPTHRFQGSLAITFKKDHPYLVPLRQMLIPAVVIAGSGTGREGHYSLAVRDALETSDLCLHDALMHKEILQHAHGEVVNVGKRYGEGKAMERQANLVQIMLDSARCGKQVIRLKGGDPSLFGRLSEEIGPLNDHHLLFRILPGIPWICSAPIRHGIYLTNREQVRHFQVATGTEIEGKTFQSQELDPVRGPIYFFMALNKLETIAKGLIERGYSPDTPSVVFREDSGPESIVRGTLKDIDANLKASKLQPPGLLLVGESAALDKTFTPSRGPLYGKRILCPGSESSRQKLTQLIEALGGLALPLEVFKLQTSSKVNWLTTIQNHDYLILASGSAVHLLLQLLKAHRIDLRLLPKIAVSGPSAATALKEHGLYPDFMPDTFTSEALALQLIKARDVHAKKILVARSDASRSPLPQLLCDAGAVVQVETLYENCPVKIDCLPEFDAVCFCSPSAVDVLYNTFSDRLKTAQHIASIGPVTTKALMQKSLTVSVEPCINDVQHLVWSLTSKLLWS